MPERYWDGRLAFVALGLVLLAIWTGFVWHSASQRQFYTDTAEQRTEAARERAKDELRDCLASGADAFECAERVVAASQEAETAEYDLAAQQEMAYWTPWILLSGVAAAITATIGVVYLAINNNITQELGQAQVRAYLAVEAASVTVGSITQDRVFWNMNIKLHNSGQSPARRVRASANFPREKNGTIFGGIFSDISAGKPDDRTIILSMSGDDLVFIDQAMTKVLLEIRLLITFFDIFDVEITEEVDIIGFASPVEGETFNLTVTNLRAFGGMTGNEKRHEGKA